MAEPVVPVQDEIEAQIGDKKLRIRGSDILSMINMAAIGIMLVGGFEHVQAAREGQKDTVNAIKEQTKVQWQMVNAQREANCLNRLTPDQKRNSEWIEYCKQLGLGR